MSIRQNLIFNMLTKYLICSLLEAALYSYSRESLLNCNFFGSIAKLFPYRIAVFSFINLWFSVEILVNPSNDRYRTPPPIKAEFPVIIEGSPCKIDILDSTK